MQGQLNSATFSNGFTISIKLLVNTDLLTALIMLMLNKSFVMLLMCSGILLV